MELVRKSFLCPHCAETVSVEIDPSVEAQAYVEDCSVCCRPISIRCTLEKGDLIAFDALPDE